MHRHQLNTPAARYSVRLPATLLRFSLAAGLAYTAYAMCRAPVLPLFARQLGAGPELVGLVAGASTLTGVLLKLPAGAISDAVGRRMVLLGAGAIFALMPLAYPWTTTIVMLILLRIVHGSATALFGPTASAALSDIVPVTERGRWLGTYAAIQGSGQAAGPVVAGWLLGRAGFASTFFVAAAIGGVAFVLLASWNGPSSRRPPFAWADVVLSVREVARDRRIVLTSIAQAGQFVLHGMITAFLPIYAVERVGLSAAEAGLLFGVQMVTTILARPLFGRVSDRVGRRPMIVTGLATCAGAVALVAWSGSFAALLACSAVYGTGLATTTTSTAALITDLTDRSRYGAAHGLFGTIFDVGDAIGPIAGGVVAARFGYHALFYASAALVVCLAGIFGVLSRRWQM
jgi:MFS transporter, DHA1 family, multidrug resistance protein